MLQRAREELDRERRNLLRRRPNYEIKEKPTKTSYTRAKSKDRGSSFVAPDESSNDGMKATTDANRALVCFYLFKQFKEKSFVLEQS
jgi:hypothetical protein